jgi:hypothetical protein
MAEKLIGVSVLINNRIYSDEEVEIERAAAVKRNPGCAVWTIDEALESMRGSMTELFIAADTVKAVIGGEVVPPPPETKAEPKKTVF